MNEIDKFIDEQNYSVKEMEELTKLIQKCITIPDTINKLPEGVRNLLSSHDVKIVSKCFQRKKDFKIKNSQIDNQSILIAITEGINKIYNTNIEDKEKLTELYRKINLAVKELESGKNPPSELNEFYTRNKEHKELIIKVLNKEANTILKKINTEDTHIYIYTLSESIDNILFIIITTNNNCEVYYNNEMILNFETLNNINRSSLDILSYTKEVNNENDTYLILDTKSLISNIKEKKVEYDISELPERLNYLYSVSTNDTTTMSKLISEYNLRTKIENNSLNPMYI